MKRSILASFALLAACGKAPASGPTYHKDVRPLLEARCTGCHREGGIGPFALTSYEAAQKQAFAVANATEQRRMPPYLAAPGCAEYADDQNLTDEQIALLRAWAEADAPEGDPKTYQPLQADTGVGELTRVDLELTMPIEYSPRTSPDDYRCFLIDWPKQTDSYVVGFRARPGNARIVHHVIAYLIPPERASEYRKLDDADPTPGYECFGGPGGSARGIAWLGAWAPGGQGAMYPEGTGLLARAGSVVALQVHYNTLSTSAAGDRTAVEVALADTVRRRAAILPWTNYQWVQGKGMSIPAGASDVRHSYAGDPTPYMGLITSGSVKSGVPLLVHAASMHQHLLGKSSRLEIRRQTGETECLLDVPRWDFHWQRSYPLARPKVFRPGDQLAIQCSWDNSAANQPFVNGQQLPPRDVQWGEGTTDEMCLGIVYVSE